MVSTSYQVILIQGFGGLFLPNMPHVAVQNGPQSSAVGSFVGSESVSVGSEQMGENGDDFAQMSWI